MSREIMLGGGIALVALLTILFGLSALPIGILCLITGIATYLILIRLEAEETFAYVLCLPVGLTMVGAASYLLGFVLGLFYALAVSVTILCVGAAAGIFYFKKRK